MTSHSSIKYNVLLNYLQIVDWFIVLFHLLREGDISQKEARNRFILVFLALDTNLSTPYWQMALWMSLVGIGAGLFNSPNSSSVMNAAGVKYRGMRC
jgi:hypothetical protein